MKFKPMLSASLDGVDLSTLRYPILVSPKLDGVRCILWEGVAYSRNAKPIRNQFVQAWAKDRHNLDGELIVGSATEGLVLNRTQSGIMSAAGEPDFTFHAFDMPERVYDRFWPNHDDMKAQLEGEPRIQVVTHSLMSYPGMLELEEEYLEAGYEGIMFRDPNGPYKYGRSTLREGWLMKLKRFQEGEGVVASLEEGTRNDNALTRDELGRAKRSTHKENLVGNGMVGTIILTDGTRVAPGIMTHSDRIYWWQSRADSMNSLVGRTIHWRSFGYGQKDTPRFPRYYGIREDV